MRETDGHIYQLAGLNECYHCQYARKMWVNTHYLEEMGVEVPQTTEEFYEVCKKFVETYPDKIAIGGASSGWYVDFVAWLMGSFTLDSGEYGKLALTPDGEIVSAATTEEWREGLRYIKSLYDIGAIYDGNFTQDAEQLRTIMNQEDVPVLFVPFGTISDGIVLIPTMKFTDSISVFLLWKDQMEHALHHTSNIVVLRQEAFLLQTSVQIRQQFFAG